MKNLYALLIITALLMLGCSSNDNPTASTETPIQLKATSLAKPVIETPVITVSASIAEVFPPNKKMVSVIFSGTYENSINTTYTLTDEYGKIVYSGTISGSPFSISLALEAHRNGKDKDGRTYTFTVTGVGGTTVTATATVTVGHDKKKDGKDNDGDDDKDDNDGHHG